MLSDLFVKGFVAHLFFDWFLQNQWIATYKTSLKHPAAWIHGGLHLLGLLFVFKPIVALVVTILHMIIDTRTLLTWWKKTFKQTREGEMGIHVAIWEDQVAHILIIFLAAWIQIRLFRKK